jgi:hypothetical protein
LATLELPVAVDGEEPEASEGTGHAAVRPYMWQPPGSQRRVSLALNVVDQILQEALRGLGSVPKRGAEIGGVLVGAIQEDGTLAITAAVPVYCSHSQGSSYTLTSHEYQEFCETVARFAPGEGRPSQAVGFYRTHTREGFGLSMDDARIFDAAFPGEWPVILLVKPSITRVSQGAFFFREDGAVRRGSSYLEFPFRRKELSGKGQAGREMTDRESDDIEDQPDEPQSDEAIAAQLGSARRRRHRQTVEPMDQLESKRERPAPSSGGSGILGLGGAAKKTDAKSDRSSKQDASLLVGEGRASTEHSDALGPKSGRRWGLIPLSFLFLMLGLFLGLQSAMIIGPHLGKAMDPFSLGLRVKPLAGQKLQIDWNLSSAPIAGAQDATLYIEDGGAMKPVPLTRTQLTSTSIEYPALSNSVHVRLDVRLRDNAIYSESVDYRRR